MSKKLTLGTPSNPGNFVFLPELPLQVEIIISRKLDAQGKFTPTIHVQAKVVDALISELHIPATASLQYIRERLTELNEKLLAGYHVDIGDDLLDLFIDEQARTEQERQQSRIVPSPLGSRKVLGNPDEE